jgi:hypothetical protein
MEVRDARSSLCRHLDRAKSTATACSSTLSVQSHMDWISSATEYLLSAHRRAAAPQHRVGRELRPLRRMRRSTYIGTKPAEWGRRIAIVGALRASPCSYECPYWQCGPKPPIDLGSPRTGKSVNRVRSSIVAATGRPKTRGIAAQDRQPTCDSADSVPLSPGTALFDKESRCAGTTLNGPLSLGSPRTTP